MNFEYIVNNETRELLKLGQSVRILPGIDCEPLLEGEQGELTRIYTQNGNKWASVRIKSKGVSVMVCAKNLTSATAKRHSVEQYLHNPSRILCVTYI